jgi:phosphate transport system protein
MGGPVESQIQRAIEALITRDDGLMERVIADDNRVNGIEVEIDENCNHIIVCRQPTVGDHRTISTAFEILFVAKAIERIGDHAKNM